MAKKQRSYQLKLTRAGALYIVMTLLLGFAAVNTGNNLLYLLVSALLGFMAISGLLGQQNLQRLEVTFRPGYELYAATRSVLEIQLHNRRRWLPAFLIRLEVAGEEVLFPLLATGQKSTQRLSIAMPLRGLHPLPTIWLGSCFPINFFIRSRIIPSDQQLLVFPRPQPCQLPVIDGDRRQQRQKELPMPGIDGEIYSIDDYQPGDPLKSIHWKMSARHGGLKSKRQQRLGSPALQLELEALPGGLEEKLNCCAWLINYYCRQQRPVGLRLGTQRLPAASGGVHRLKMLTALACHDQR